MVGTMAEIDDSVKKKVPELRFKGFTDDWEERKLIEVADYRNGKAHEKDISECGDYIVVNSKFVSTNGLVKKYCDEMIAPLYKNEIAFVLSDVPNGRAIARTFLINEDNKYSLNQRIAGITPHADTNSYFLHSLMNRNHYFLRFDDGVSQTNLSKKEVEKWVEFYPSYEEQQKIGSFFKQLDEIIALHQRKLDLLEEQKKGFLQKMFPKNGEKVPELRFKGFTDDWEERKFESLLDKNEGVRRGPFGSALKKDLFVKESPYVVYEQQNAIYDHYETRYNISKEKFEELHKFELIADDFIMSGAGTIGRISKVPKGIKKGVFNQALIRFRINKELTDSEYFLQFIRADFMQRKFTGANPGSAITNLVPMSDVKKWEIKVPIKEEQQKIGSFFKQLDDIIALHQRKLDLLKEQKKGFLQKMFV